MAYCSYCKVIFPTREGVERKTNDQLVFDGIFEIKYNDEGEKIYNYRYNVHCTNCNRKLFKPWATSFEHYKTLELKDISNEIARVKKEIEEKSKPSAINEYDSDYKNFKRKDEDKFQWGTMFFGIIVTAIGLHALYHKVYVIAIIAVIVGSLFLYMVFDSYRSKDKIILDEKKELVNQALNHLKKDLKQYESRYKDLMNETDIKRK